MSNEIEIKIPLKNEEFERIENLISQNGQNSACENLFFSDFKKIFKSDEYFSRYKTRAERKNAGEFEVIRIRTEKIGGEEKSFFTTKRKSLVDGFEVNEEKETFVENPEVIRNFLLESGFIKWFEKTKDAESVFCRLKNGRNLKFHLELEKVNGFLYIEIECTESGDCQNRDVFSELEKVVENLALDIRKNDPRSWIEILK